MHTKNRSQRARELRAKDPALTITEIANITGLKPQSVINALRAQSSKRGKPKQPGEHAR